MKLGPKLILPLAVVSAAVVACLTCLRRPGTLVEDKVAGAPNAPSRVLIATEGTAFKLAVVAGVVRQIRTNTCSVKVTDVRHLDDVEANRYDAVLVLSSVVLGRLHKAVHAWLADQRSRGRTIVLVTARNVDWRLEEPGIDAVTSASTMSDADAVARRLAGCLRRHLGLPEQ